MAHSSDVSGTVCPLAKHHADPQQTTKVQYPREDSRRGEVEREMRTADGVGHARGWFARFLEISLQYRLTGLIVLHALVFASVYLLCYVIRFDGSIPPAYLEAAIATLPLVVLLKLSSCLATGSHRGLWRYLTFADMTALAESVTLGSIALTAVCFLSWGRLPIPRSIVVMDWAGTMCILGGLRGSVRSLRERYCPMLSTRPLERVLIVGAGEAGEILVREIRAQTHLGLKVVGILDTDRATHGWMLAGIKILGSPASLRQHAPRLGVQKVLVPTSAVSAQDLRDLVFTCGELGVKIQVIPALDDLLTGAVEIRPRDVDIHDLLCREPIHLDGEAIGRFLRGRLVLVTGAAGSIGSEICRQVLAFRPERLILLDHSENGLFFTERELRASAGQTEVVPCVASITDAARLRTVFARYRPDVIYHAAAHKHVPMMEANPGEAIKNNIFGTRTLVDEAIHCGVEAFVMISTDKAVNPTSIMGVCKRLAEMYVQARAGQTSTRLVTVRFGNVLGSNGSVVPLFKEQIRRGGPVTITHPEMIRYFMTIPEAAQLVLQAGTLGRGGEIFVLDMGEPVRILDLARDLIRLSGLKEGKDIEIVSLGLRPGEKLFEELYEEHEERLPTPHPKIFLAQHRSCSLEWVQAQLGELARQCDGPADEVVAALKELVPEYRPTRLEGREKTLGVGPSSRPLLPVTGMIGSPRSNLPDSGGRSTPTRCTSMT
jgi:FlaA1/EpsC-like NDP-sugar epimerase